MPLYALDSNGQLIVAQKASRDSHYQCLECCQPVRLRGGPHRRPHFFHSEMSRYCRQNQKGEVHLQNQLSLLRQFPQNDCLMEHPFPSISRIADVAWLSKKMIFEIQCSPISAEEVIARNRDYQSIGWQVVWILHDQRYNQLRLSRAEMALRSTPHFFSSINHLGIGIIYDQFDLCDGRIRHFRLPPLVVQINVFVSSPNGNLFFPFDLLKQRALQWHSSFQGDLLNHFLNHPDSAYLKQAQEKINAFTQSSSFDSIHWFFKGWHKFVVTPYRQLFRFLLEKMCR